MYYIVLPLLVNSTGRCIFGILSSRTSAVKREGSCQGTIRPSVVYSGVCIAMLSPCSGTALNLEQGALVRFLICVDSRKLQNDPSMRSDTAYTRYDRLTLS